MSRKPRRNHLPTFKANVALEVLRGEKTLAELTKQFDVPPNPITDRKNQLFEHAARVFGAETLISKELHAQIGQQALEINF